MRNNIKNRRKFIFLAGAFILSAMAFAAIPYFTAEAGKKADGQVIQSPSAAFTAGNPVVCRIGDGSAALSNASTAVFVEEHSAVDGSLVQSIALPTAASGANQILTAAGNATTECQLNRSTDGKYLIITGYNVAPGTAGVSSSTSASVPRVIGRIAADGTIDTTTTTTSFSGGSIRSATSDNGTNFWSVGANTGVVYGTLGSSGAGTVVSSTATNFRSVSIYGGQLYISNSSTTAARIGAVGTGLPTTTGQTITNINGFPTSSSTNQFFFADLDSSVAGVDTLYTADDGTGTGATGGGVKKFSFFAGNWVYNGTFPANGTTIPATSFLGLTGSVSGTTVTLYGARASQFVSFVDSTGYNVAPTAVPTLLSTAAANTAYRGVALAPVGSVAVTPQRPNVDFDGDRKSDYVVTRNVGGNKEFYVTYNGVYNFAPYQNGVDSDVAIPADFDGDGKADVAVWRAGPPFQAAFYILQSSTNTLRTQAFGQTGDIPNVTADYDGDGKADPAIYRPGATGQQGVYAYLPSSNNPNNTVYVVNWGGGPETRPYPGDFDGDGKADFCLNMPVNGSQQFVLLRNADKGVEFINWGLATDHLVSGDFDADAKSDFCVVRETNGQYLWCVLTRKGVITLSNWGLSTDALTPGDYDGDGKTDLSVFRDTDGAFYTLKSTNNTFLPFQWGTTGDKASANWLVIQ